MKHMYYIKGDKISRGTLRGMLELIQEQVMANGGVYVTVHGKGLPKPKRKPWTKSTNRTQRTIRAITGYKTPDESNATERKLKANLKAILS